MSWKCLIMYAVILSILAWQMINLGESIFQARYAMMDIHNSKAMEMMGGK